MFSKIDTKLWAMCKEKYKKTEICLPGEKTDHSNMNTI